MAKEGIVIIEDNPGDATIFMMAFKRSCPEKKVVWFDAGKKALDYIFARGKYSDRDPEAVPELIVLDLSLPDISGKEILKKLRPLMDKHDFEVVVITGSYDEHDKDESYELGARQFVSKSIACENSLKVIISDRAENSLQQMLKDACDFEHSRRF
jgi:two-component system, response regulator